MNYSDKFKKKINETMRLVAWLKANSKHMEHEEEQIHMLKAAGMLEFLLDIVVSQERVIMKADNVMDKLQKILDGKGELPKQTSH